MYKQLYPHNTLFGKKQLQHNKLEMLKQIKKGDKIEKFEAKKATEILLYKPKKKNKPKKKKQGTLIDFLSSMFSYFLNKVFIKLDIPKKYGILQVQWNLKTTIYYYKDEKSLDLKYLF